MFGFKFYQLLIATGFNYVFSKTSFTICIHIYLIH